MSRSLEVMGEACAGFQMVRKRMFGGYGYFAPNGAMFAGIVTDDAIVLKLARGDARDELIGLGGHPWTYEGRDKPMTMHEWIVVPDAFYDDIETLRAWLERALRLVPAKVEPSKRSAKVKSRSVVATADSVATKKKTSTRAVKASTRVTKVRASTTKVGTASKRKTGTKASRS